MAEAKPKRKRSKAKLALLVVLPLVIVLGAGAGVAFVRGMGPFAKAKAKAPVSLPKPEAVVKKTKPKTPEAPPVVATPPAPKPMTKRDEDAGAAKLARLWNEVEAPKLLAIAKDWKERDLARVVVRMDAEKVAEVLSLLPPKRASALSREMQRLGSVVPVE